MNETDYAKSEKSRVHMLFPKSLHEYAKELAYLRRTSVTGLFEALVKAEVERERERIGRSLAAKGLQEPSGVAA